MKDIKIGSLIKSYDFKGHNDCYLIGVVDTLNENDGLISGKIVRRVLQGRDIDLAQCGDRFSTPMPAMLLFGEFEGRVTVLMNPNFNVNLYSYFTAADFAAVNKVSVSTARRMLGELEGFKLVESWITTEDHPKSSSRINYGPLPPHKVRYYRPTK